MLIQFFDVIFGFLLDWHPLAAILLVSAVVSIVIVLSYKFFTDQGEMKRLKDELARFQKRMKELREHPEKMMELQKKAMAVNMQYMAKSMKPTLVTFIPILLVFGWMNAHFAFEPLSPGERFALSAVVQKGVSGNVSIVVPDGLRASPSSAAIVDSKAVFELSGEGGKYLVTLASNGEEVDKEVIITTERKYSDVVQQYKGKVFSRVELGNQKLLVLWKIGWLGTYIIAAIVLSSGLRKVLKVY
ncbi:DUF106 domain-containing protein [Candidatus Woesearchaeota archaeon]|nr:DUF106 domain-containing protein [Candidatus Woesearchaeota archaeon]